MTPKPGDVFSITGAYAINPEYYEVDAELSAPALLGELMTLENDSRVWRVVRVDGLNVTLRLEMSPRTVAILH